MANEDLNVLRKVYNNVNSYEWEVLSPREEYYRSMSFPIEAEKNINSFSAEIIRGLVVITGAYQSRFYYEEDKYSWQQKEYASIISTLNDKINNVYFITSEDYENSIKKKNLFNFGVGSLAGDKNETNIISEIYNLVNRKVSGISDLYSKFLDKDE